jgi:stage II sporulation protein D
MTARQGSIPRMRRLSAAALACLLLPASAQAAKSSFVIRGAGFGHGIGLSQYGADGYAQHGFGYRDIVGHYYSGTGLATVSPSPTVRVLLESAAAPSFTGAAKAGDRILDPAKTYSVVRAGANSVTLRGPAGHDLAGFDGTLRVTGPGPLRLNGAAGNGVRDGRYRGALEFRTGLFGGVSAINALGLEDYIRGVVSAESPASWPAAALEAQAVVARSYAITTDAGSANDGFTAYPDTRSQMYRGVAAEFASTETAVNATKGQVVTYSGKPVVTYFFSTSGGKTENVENSFVGALPRPWLKGVDDPFDSVSPRHRWGPYRMTLAQAGAKLGGLVKGRFKSIKVLERGFSPRVVHAQVIGTRGRTNVTGADLRRRFGLYDSWAYYTSITSKAKKVTPAGTPAPIPGGQADAGSGGTAPAAPAGTARAGRTALSGTIAPARRGSWLRIQRRAGAHWVTYAWTTVGAHGRYDVRLGAPGAYRVLLRGAAGPTITVR